MSTIRPYSIDEDDEEDDDDVTAKAYASIAAQLQQFTSPKLGSSLILQEEQEIEESHNNNNNDDPSYYGMDAMEWMEQELQEPAVTTTTRARATTATPPASTNNFLKRTPLLERADTPIMSNSSSKHKKKPKKKKYLSARHDEDDDDDDDDDDDELMMEPIQTPFKKPHPMTIRATSAPATLALTTTTRSLMATTATTSGDHYVYRRYHDSLWNYLKGKRSLSHRMDLEQQDQELTTGTTGAASASASASSLLSTQEARVELDFLKSLNQSCWTSTSSLPEQQQQQRSEGNLWILLVTLRRLGLSALIWNDDRISAGQHSSAQTGFLQSLASQVSATPKELIEELTSMSTSSSSSSAAAPLVLQRRYQILQWIQTCMDQVRIEPKASNNNNSNNNNNMASAIITHPDDSNVPSLVQDNNAQQSLLQSCFSYMLAGRLEEAKAMVRAHGQPWRAAAWSGGDPAGFQKMVNEQTKTIDKIPVGNPNRFLWKRQAWKSGQRLLSSSNTNSPDTEEAAIYSLLANDVDTCLSILRNNNGDWEQSLSVVLSSLWGRLEDELLHRHNTIRRKCRGPPYPGTGYLKQELEQLMATSTLAGMTAGMTESQVVQLLLSTPYNPRGTECYESAMAAFFVGKSAILDYCQVQTSQIFEEDNDGDGAVSQLRFLTHLTLYLDSLHASTTPIVLEGLTEQKNQILFQYVQYLESRPDLWHMLALYVSLLPEEQLLDYYPQFLTKVLETTERKSMLEQIRDLFPNLEIPVLRQAVRLSLSSSSATETELYDDDDDDDEDERKCRSMEWLLYSDEHMGDALICANILLRDFFLNEQDDKMEAAMALVADVMPEDLCDRAGQQQATTATTTTATTTTMDDGQWDETTYATKVDNARSEYLAFVSYLEAYRTFGKWKEVLSTTSTTTNTNTNNNTVDVSMLNPTETNIAQQRMVKDWLRAKKATCQTVIEAAEQARKVLYDVLTHPGGWLSIDDEEGTMMEQGDNDNDDNNMDMVDNRDPETKTRHREIKEIRARYLVLAVNLYHQVCEETASWMSRSLDDASTVHMSPKQAALLLSPKQAAPLSPPPYCDYYAPSYWYQEALELATLVADDRHGIHKAAFRSNTIELQEFLAKLAETAVSKLMNV
jgi:hypothetical protein